MAKPLHHPLNLLFIIILLLLNESFQLQSSQYQALLKLQQLLNYPPVLSSWSESTSFCNTEPSQSVTLACYEGNITQLHITGNIGFPPLPQDFSTSSLFSVLASFPSLKVLSLVSLGLWGPLHRNIGSLSSLEILNISSNYFDGTIPLEISYLSNLQTLILDHNRFNGSIPHQLSSLPALAVMSMKNNSLDGSLPTSFSSSETLRIMALSANNFSGDVPDISNLTNLQVLDLQDNSFGPHFPHLPNKLVSLVLRKNKFRIGLSANLSSFYQLQKLDLSQNDFVGPFLPSLFSLPSLTYLDIAGNKFTGRLFGNLSCNGELDFVDLSSNLLTGDLPECLELDSKSRVVKYAGNCLSRGDHQKQHPYSFCYNEALAVEIIPSRQKEKRPYGKAVLASSMVGGLVGGLALLGLALLVVRKEYAKKMTQIPQTRLILEKVPAACTLKLLTDARYISETMKLGSLGGLPSYRTFVLEEIQEATNNFDTSNLMGEGSQGQVYKGWLADGTPVAIRSLKMRKRHNVQTYTHQIESISKLRHCHLISAIGHCFECNPDGSGVSTIYILSEFAPRGTLRSFISEGNSEEKFSWTQRLAAAVSIARGMQFLHTGIVPGVFSNQLKITDVLLDHDLHVKISRYNLPLLAENRRLVPKTQFLTRTNNKVERSGYVDRDDVYDFGVILLEIIVGRSINSKNDIVVSKDILVVSSTADEIARRSIVDPTIHKDSADESLKIVIELCLRCLSEKQSDRPSIEDVLWNLQFAAQVQDSWRDSNSSQGSPVL